MNYQELLNLISVRLNSLKPYKAILFGSAAYGKPEASSDIDIVVVLNKNGFPADYNEKMNNHRLVRKLLRDINQEVALDIIVFTIDEWESFVKTGSYFSRIVVEKGKAIA